MYIIYLCLIEIQRFIFNSLEFKPNRVFHCNLFNNRIKIYRIWEFLKCFLFLFNIYIINIFVCYMQVTHSAQPNNLNSSEEEKTRSTFIPYLPLSQHWLGENSQDSLNWMFVAVPFDRPNRRRYHRCQVVSSRLFLQNTSHSGYTASTLWQDSLGVYRQQCHMCRQVVSLALRFCVFDLVTWGNSRLANLRCHRSVASRLASTPRDVIGQWSSWMVTFACCKSPRSNRSLFGGSNCSSQGRTWPIPYSSDCSSKSGIDLSDLRDPLCPDNWIVAINTNRCRAPKRLESVAVLLMFQSVFSHQIPA